MDISTLEDEITPLPRNAGTNHPVRRDVTSQKNADLHCAAAKA
jgi:hypothetical protein